MSSVWEFLKRHRGKIATAGVIIGGVYGVKKAIELNALEQLKGNHSVTIEPDEKLSKSRKHFIFDSHQQSCDKQVQLVLNDVKSLIQAHFNVEELVDRLKNSDELSAVEKVHIWEEIKVKSFARILAVAFIYPLIAVVFKTQKSIICRENCKRYENNSQNSKNSFLSYASSYIWREDDRSKVEAAPDPKIQQLFLNCTQFFTTSGINQLFDRIQRVSKELVSSLLLNKPVSPEDIKFLLDKAKTKIQGLYGSKNFADLVVPQRNIQGSFNVVNTVHLETLLTNFSDMLQSQSCGQLISNFTQQYLDHTKELISGDLNDKQVPLAKLLPVLTDSFSDLSKTNPLNASRTEALEICCSFNKLYARETESKMKIKRYKRAQRILTFFRYNFGYAPPFTVLLDGTFCQAALQNKVNLREQMPKYMAEETEMVTSSCVINELEKLGSDVYGALVICKQFDIAPCPHHPHRTAADCLAHLARRSKKGKAPKYFIATQDEQLIAKIKEMGGVPTMSVKFNGILLDKPSESSIKQADKSYDEIEKVKELKKAIIGEPQIKKKKKGPKGPNPLSCKKKKPKPIGNNGAFGKSMNNNDENTKKKRKRRKEKSLSKKNIES
uniref:rRNA-processing protein UTP23 homolog n=1 Tax=Acrobeloides nanus TaxID=290746 RepID=A0A914CCS5_9BILA